MSPSSQMFLPPIVEDLWPVLRDRAASATMTTLLGGSGRLFTEGEYTGTPAGESTDWRRGVIIPVVPVGGIGWREGLPTRLRWIFRVDMNDIEHQGLKSSVWASRAGQLVHREAARRWVGWNPNTVLASSQVMVVGEIELDEGWHPKVIPDPDRTGTVFMSSSFMIDVASAAD